MARFLVLLLAPTVVLISACFGLRIGTAEPPCFGQNRDWCLEPQTGLESISEGRCEGSKTRVCLVPLGRIDPALVDHLVAYYREEYGLQVKVLTPSAIPEDIHDPTRGQIDGGTLARYMGELFPENYADADAVLIGLTPVDLYLTTEDWRFAFWAASAEINKGVVSSFRMNPETFGMDRDDRVLCTRVRKVVTRIIGTLHYRLAESEDPRSVLYNNVLSVDDLDLMGEKLPIEVSR